MNENSIPIYPSNFYNFEDGYDVPEEVVQSYIKETIENAKINKDGWSFISCGNTFVCSYRIDSEGIIETIVTKNYMRSSYQI